MKSVLILLALFAMFLTLGADDSVEDNATRSDCEMIHGHRLPPEPDPKINNSTLLGIDANNNGVRDDVERWIYTRYDKHIPCKMVQDGNVTLPDGSTVPTFQKVCAEEEVPYHRIVREIAMQFGRAAQIVIQEPEKARETVEYIPNSSHKCNISLCC